MENPLREGTSTFHVKDLTFKSENKDSEFVKFLIEEGFQSYKITTGSLRRTRSQLLININSKSYCPIIVGAGICETIGKLITSNEFIIIYNILKK